MRVEHTDFLILGAGVAGLAAAAELGPRARVLERDDRPGGLVRAECFGGYWFDRVLHLLYFQDPAQREWVLGMTNGEMEPCPPDAWVETAAGVARYPIQFHLAGLEPAARERCLHDLLAAADAPDVAPGEQPAYDEYLLRSFGAALCELFYFPYNRKMWRRPLEELVAGGAKWNLQRPSPAEAVRGARGDAAPDPAYNADAFYPRPPADAPVRGMEVLSRALAARAPGLRLNSEVVGIDPVRRTVYAREGGERVAYRYEHGCLCTLPLPRAIALCSNATPAVRRAADALPHNAVLCAALCIRGPRPQRPGLWRYYADESICFTRLVFMTEFDPLNAPPDGWGLLAEIPVRAGEPRPSDAKVLERVRRDVDRTGILPPGCTVEDARLMVADPAYVVFNRGTQDAAVACRAHLAHGGIAALGRYGRWEYGSIAHAMGQGRAWAKAMDAAAAAVAG